MWDIYGQPLKRGHCEVHSWINEEYPCSICISENEKSQKEKKYSEQNYEISKLKAHIKRLEAVRDAAKEILETCIPESSDGYQEIHARMLEKVLKACQPQATEGSE